MKVNVLDLFNELSKINEIEAIALGGSRATGKHDEKSDYDVYIYTTGNIEENVRRNILSKYCKYMEISNTFWEFEDDVTLNDGIDMDIIYRNLNDFDNTLYSIVFEHNAWNCYTTCMWHNLKTCKIIVDKTGNLTKVQQKYNIPYPKQLKSNIIANGLNLLSGMLPSYDKQIIKAIERNDLVSVNHRVTEFLATYFDVIFAINEMTHPGEKRMQSICSNECKILPNNFDLNLDKLFKNMFTSEVGSIINEIVEELKEVCFNNQ